MKYRNINRRARLGTALGALALCLGTVTVSDPASAATRTYRPTSQVLQGRRGGGKGVAGRVSDTVNLEF